MNTTLNFICEIFEVIGNMFLGFFIVITGSQLLPEIAQISSKGSFVPGIYAISIFISLIYFFIYKPIRIAFR